VEAIWYFIKYHVANPDAAHTAYMKAAIAAGFSTLSMLDRKDLIAYLTGERATSDRIDITVPVIVDEEGVSTVDAKRAREEDEAEGVPRERVLRDRNSVLRAPKDMTSVLDFFAAPEEEKERLEEEKQQAADLAKGIKNQRYRDVKEQVFWREHVGSDFDMMNLDTNASFLSGPKPPVDDGTDMLMTDARAMEKQPTAPSGPSTASRGGPAAAAKAPRKTSGKPGGVPIIIVPAGFNQKVVLNMFNAKEFLQDGKFTQWDVVQKGGAKKSSSVYISRTYKRDGAKVSTKSPKKPLTNVPKTGPASPRSSSSVLSGNSKTGPSAASKTAISSKPSPRFAAFTPASTAIPKSTSSRPGTSSPSPSVAPSVTAIAPRSSSSGTSSIVTSPFVAAP